MWEGVVFEVFRGLSKFLQLAAFYWLNEKGERKEGRGGKKRRGEEGGWKRRERKERREEKIDKGREIRRRRRKRQNDLLSSTVNDQLTERLNVLQFFNCSLGVGSRDLFRCTAESDDRFCSSPALVFPPHSPS